MIVHPEGLERSVRVRRAWLLFWMLPAVIAVALVLAVAALTP